MSCVHLDQNEVGQEVYAREGPRYLVIIRPMGVTSSHLPGGGDMSKTRDKHGGGLYDEPERCLEDAPQQIIVDNPRCSQRTKEPKQLRSEVDQIL